jgi:predicted nucleic acid-binding Zn ribbon protein
MDCQHCGKKVSIIRALTDSQYCCEDHRCTHMKEMNRLGLALLMGHGGMTGQREHFTERSPDSTESACFRIGARVIQPPVIV